MIKYYRIKFTSIQRQNKEEKKERTYTAAFHVRSFVPSIQTQSKAEISESQSPSF